jgi:hypothetical protein
MSVITVHLDAPDDETLADLVAIIERVAPYMVDNVVVTSAENAPDVSMRDVRKAFATAFMNHPTGRMLDADVLAVLDVLDPS